MYVCMYVHVQVKLKDSLMSSVLFSKAKDAELAWLDGQIHINPAANLGQYINRTEDSKESIARELNLVPILDAVPSTEVLAVSGLVTSQKRRGFIKCSKDHLASTGTHSAS